MLRAKIYEQLISAMKAQEKVKLEALRYLWSLIKNVEIDAKHELTDEEVMKVIGSEVKKRKESIEQIRGGGREELAQEEEAKLKVLQEFLPEQMGEEEISALVNQIIGESAEKDFGSIMRQVMAKAAGKADGRTVSEIVRQKLGGEGNG